MHDDFAYYVFIGDGTTTRDTASASFRPLTTPRIKQFSICRTNRTAPPRLKPVTDWNTIVSRVITFAICTFRWRHGVSSSPHPRSTRGKKFWWKTILTSVHDNYVYLYTLSVRGNSDLTGDQIDYDFFFFMLGKHNVLPNDLSVLHLNLSYRTSLCLLL